MNETVSFQHYVEQGETFDIYDGSFSEIITHLIVGFYTGDANHANEMFTLTKNFESELTEYHQWRQVPETIGTWERIAHSTWTELDCVCTLFHKKLDVNLR
jgi:hypothetical protein